MCNCQALPAYVADISYGQNRFQFIGEHLHADYFMPPDSEHFSPALDYSQNQYLCLECGQQWYFECAPEQTSFPLFALKLISDAEPGVTEINAAKQFLAILAHDGFASEKCRMKGCENFKLKGREMCHLHLRFPD
ncbi:hypothetical protein VW41_05210 [Klebsiella michiganensis]|nr:hypothetical protein VW41_05210 [Klebsiella michiganensis]